MGQAMDSGGETGWRVLSRGERFWVVFVLLGLVLYGGHVERRSVFLKRRMTDLGVYLRAAWAVRTDRDPYAITDTNGFHYVYPPLFAILLTPFAEAPAGASGGSGLPFGVAVAGWYVFSVLCLLWAVHWLATSVERCKTDPGAPVEPVGSWRWWMLRLVPTLVCLPMVFGTLVHGQVNLLLLALVCGMAGALMRQRRLLGGFFLAGAICLKVFPAFLIVHLLWRRDIRALVGCTVGLVLGVVVVPSAVWGPGRALWLHQRFADVVLLPGLGLGTDQSRAKELTEVTATDSQSLVAVIHNTLHLDQATRPHQPAGWVRGLALLLAAGLTMSTLALGRQPREPIFELLTIGQLTIVMLLLCPVCHLSYFCLTLPLVMVIVETQWIPAAAACKNAGVADVAPARRTIRRLNALFTALIVAHTLPHVPGLGILRDTGLATYAALSVWAIGVTIGRDLRRAKPAQAVGTGKLLAAA